MKNQRRIRNLFVAATAVLLLTGCQSDNALSSAEVDALRQQIAQLEQQVSALEQQVSVLEQQAADRHSNTQQEAAVAQGSVPEQTLSTESVNIGTQSQNDLVADDGQQPQNDTSTAGEKQSQSDTDTTSVQLPQNNLDNTASGSLTTYTIEELGSMVEAYVVKANASEPSGTVAECMEQFFVLKQEEEQIDRLLDQHEDELEMLYRSQSVTREEYSRRERELERLEDALDDAEDYLELVFGIDD